MAKHYQIVEEKITTGPPTCSPGSWPLYALDPDGRAPKHWGPRRPPMGAGKGIFQLACSWTNTHRLSQLN